MITFKTNALTAVAAMILATAAAANDRFDPKSYPKGGFAPISNAAYSKECGSCHFTFLPGLLPARSWHALMQKTNEHFGETLNLSADTVRQLDEYLTASAGDHSDYDGPPILFRHLKDSVTPIRITNLPMMHRNHEVVKSVMRTNSTMKVKGITNCGECHTGAASGSFANRELIIPDFTTAHETPLPR